MPDGTITIPGFDYSAIEYALAAAADALEKQDAANAAMNLADVRPRPLTALVRDAQRKARSYFPSEQEPRSAFKPPVQP